MTRKEIKRHLIEICCYMTPDTKKRKKIKRMSVEELLKIIENDVKDVVYFPLD